MKIDINFKDNNDLLLLLKVFDKYSHNIKSYNEIDVKAMGEINFIQALAHLNFKNNVDEDKNEPSNF